MPKNSRGLLAHVVTKFVPRQWENIASESLLYLLPKAGGNLALNHLLAPVGFRLEGETWRPQDGSGEDSSIPDLVAKVHDRPKLIIETKLLLGDMHQGNKSGPAISWIARHRHVLR